MKRLLIAMVAIGSAPYLQAGPVKDKTKSARDERMQERQDEKDAAKQEKERKKREAANLAPKKSATVAQLEAKRFRLEEKQDQLRCALKDAISENRRETDRRQREEGDQVAADRRDVFNAKKCATPKEYDQLDQEAKSLSNLADTPTMAEIRAEYMEVGKQITQVHKDIAEAREDERKIHVKAGDIDVADGGQHYYDKLRDTQAMREATYEVKGHHRVPNGRYSNEEKKRGEMRKKVRKEMGLRKNENLVRPTCHQMKFHQKKMIIRDRMNRRAQAAQLTTDSAKESKAQQRKEEKAARKAKFAKNKQTSGQANSQQAKSKGSMFNGSATPAADSKKATRQERVAKKKAADKKKADQAAAEKQRKADAKAKKKADKAKKDAKADEQKAAKKQTNRNGRLLNDNDQAQQQ